jgi:hypothetical protein
MKTTLLSFFLLFTTIIGFSQIAIEQLQSATGSQYIEVTGVIDQSPTGASASWDFTSLTATTTVLTDTYTNTPPNSTIQTTEGVTLISEIGLNTTAGELSVTSAFSSGIQLNYSDYAKIGTFPLSFGYSITDGVEGTFTGPVSGNVVNTSTVNVNVDAWGNLKVGTFDGPVTRLKIVQDLDLLVGGFVTGTAMQTSYFYYDASNDDLVFRTTRLQVTAPATDIDDTIMESLSTYTLSASKNKIAENDIKLQTNPVKNELSFITSNFINIKAVNILDISGRIVLKADTSKSTINVSQLTSGIFLASITTNKGVMTKKFLKK